MDFLAHYAVTSFFFFGVLAVAAAPPPRRPMRFGFSAGAAALDERTDSGRLVELDRDVAGALEDLADAAARARLPALERRALVDVDGAR